MITRREISGIHLYERKTGFHCLLDEIRISEKEAALCGPRHLSIMLTNRCDCFCYYCYSEIGHQDMPYSLLQEVCKAATELQVLDITVGGGEPTLYPDFVNRISSIWRNFPFGLSVTTNGFDYEKLFRIAEHGCRIRISLDPFIKGLTPKRLDSLKRLHDHSALAINLLCPPNAIGWIESIVNKLMRIGINDIMLIPQHYKGRFVLSNRDWAQLTELVQNNSQTNFSITADAVMNVPFDVLPTANQYEYLFAHIDMLGHIKARSWGPAIGRASNAQELITELRKQHPIRRNQNENLD